MNFKSMAIAAMAAMIGFSACSKEGDGDGGTDNGAPTSVSLKLGESATPRAVAAPGKVEAVNFKSGYVIFTNNLGIINKVTEITATDPAQADKDAGTKVWITTLKTANNGAEIKNVPAAALQGKVYVVGNLPTGVTAPALSENITAVQDRLITIASQGNAAGSVEDVTLYGDGASIVNTHPTLGPGVNYVAIDVNAIAARIEIGAVTYQNTSTNFVTGFQLDGIFVNYYYPQMSLASKVSTALVNNAPANNAQADLWYAPGVTGKYDGLTALYDYDATAGLGFSVSAISFSAADPAVVTDENVWAYNVIAPKSVDGVTVTSLEAPHVVIRLSDVTTVNDTPTVQYPTTQYLTVKEFRDKGTGTVITSFQPGYIYFITDLTFDESNLIDIPEAKPVTVHVEAKLMSWTRQEVDWGF